MLLVGELVFVKILVAKLPGIFYISILTKILKKELGNFLFVFFLCNHIVQLKLLEGLDKGALMLAKNQLAHKL